ncbi:MAG: acyl-CoA thioesterase II [Halioglobus sp.]|nr:acyl-CoA thioesterase II [Halioglobus sp.]
MAKDDLGKLLAFLVVEEVGEHVFEGKSPKRPSRVFGGQVLAQALDAAARTVAPDRFAHSLHAYFLRPGNPAKTIRFEVDLIRDGGSFTTRNVIAYQDNKAIFSTSISFHIDEPGLTHQSDMPDVPPPEGLESEFDRWKKLAEEHPDEFDAPIVHPIERIAVEPRDFIRPEPRKPTYHYWLRALGNPGKDYRRHQILMAFMSDFGLLGTSLMPHSYSGWSDDIMSASLDHALWFHRRFRVDDYLLYTMDSPAAAGGRGFSRGSFYTRSGELVASAAQECLIRVREN